MLKSVHDSRFAAPLTFVIRYKAWRFTIATLISTRLRAIRASCVANNWRDDRCVVPNLRRALPIPPTSLYVYVWDGTAPVPPGFTIAKHSSRLGTANRMIALQRQHGWD